MAEKLIQQYFDSDVATNLVTTTGNMTSSAVSFPKMYVCNVYKLRKSFINAIFNYNATIGPISILALNVAFYREFITGVTLCLLFLYLFE